MRPRAVVFKSCQTFHAVPDKPLADGPRADAYGSCGGLRRLPAEHLAHDPPSTLRRQACILMDVHSVLRGITETSQPQLPASGPSGQPIESSQLARLRRAAAAPRRTAWCFSQGSTAICPTATCGGSATPWTPATRSAQTRRDDRDTFIERLSDFLHDLIQLGAITARSPGCRSIQRSSLREGVADASSPICPAGFSCAPRCAKGASESFSIQTYGAAALNFGIFDRGVQNFGPYPEPRAL